MRLFIDPRDLSYCSVDWDVLINKLYHADQKVSFDREPGLGQESATQLLEWGQTDDDDVDLQPGCQQHRSIGHNQASDRDGSVLSVVGR
jgi:hypothetical protein